MSKYFPFYAYALSFDSIFTRVGCKSLLKKNSTRILKGLPKTSKYWQDWKKNNPKLNTELRSIAIGMLLGDAGAHKVGKDAYLKFEQGYAQKDFVEHLFKNFKLYTFMETPSGYIKKEVVHSYWFKTYSHPTFTELWELFYKPIKDISGKIKYKKTVSGELLKELNDVVLAFWIMCDGSLQKDKKTMIILRTHSKLWLWNKFINIFRIK